jgi:hypothetical protein
LINKNLLIGAEGAKTPAGVRGWGDPTGASAPRRLPGTPAESEVPGAQINKQFNKDIKKTADKPKFIGFVDSLKGRALLFLFLFLQ